MNAEEKLKKNKKYGYDFISNLSDTFEKESDRGIILISASTIDSVLRDLIEKYMNRNPGRKKEIEKLFEYPNPLSSFASKIQMSYCLGIIPKEMYEDFELIRKIRNQLAHGFDFKDFSSKEIADLVCKLEGAKICIKSMELKEPDNKEITKDFKDENEKMDIRNISKLVFLTTVMYWLGKLTKYIINTPDFLLDNDIKKLIVIYKSLHKEHE